MEYKQSAAKCVKATMVLLANICFATFALADDGAGFRPHQESGSSVANDRNFEGSVEKIRHLKKFGISKDLTDVSKPSIDDRYRDKILAPTTTNAFPGVNAYDGSGFRGPQDSGPSVAIESNFEVSLAKIRRLNKYCISKGLADVLRPLIDSEYRNELIEATKGHTYSDDSDWYEVRVNKSYFLASSCSIGRKNYDQFRSYGEDYYEPFIYIGLYKTCKKENGFYGESNFVFNRQNKDHVDLMNSPELNDFPQLKFTKTQLKPIHFINGMPDKSVEVANGITLITPKDMKDLEVLYQVYRSNDDPKNAALIESQLIFNSGSVVQCLMNGLTDGTK